MLSPCFSLAFQVPNVASAQAVDAQAAYAQALDLLRNGKNADALAVINAAIEAGLVIRLFTISKVSPPANSVAIRKRRKAFEP